MNHESTTHLNDNFARRAAFVQSVLWEILDARAEQNVTEQYIVLAIAADEVGAIAFNFVRGEEAKASIDAPSQYIPYNYKSVATLKDLVEWAFHFTGSHSCPYTHSMITPDDLLILALGFGGASWFHLKRLEGGGYNLPAPLDGASHLFSVNEPDVGKCRHRPDLMRRLIGEE